MLKNVKECACELGVSERHARKMIQKKQWPHYRLGPRVIRCDPEEIKHMGRLIAEGRPEEVRDSRE